MLLGLSAKAIEECEIARIMIFYHEFLYEKEKAQFIFHANKLLISIPYG